MIEGENKLKEEGKLISTILLDKQRNLEETDNLKPEVYYEIKRRLFLLENALSFKNENHLTFNIDTLKSTRDFYLACIQMLKSNCPIEISKVDPEITPKDIFGMDDKERKASNFFKLEYTHINALLNEKYNYMKSVQQDTVSLLKAKAQNSAITTEEISQGVSKICEDIKKTSEQIKVIRKLAENPWQPPPEIEMQKFSFIEVKKNKSLYPNKIRISYSPSDAFKKKSNYTISMNLIHQGNHLCQEIILQGNIPDTRIIEISEIQIQTIHLANLEIKAIAKCIFSKIKLKLNKSVPLEKLEYQNSIQNLFKTEKDRHTFDVIIIRLQLKFIAQKFL